MSLTVRLVTEHADVGSLERTIGRALAEAGVTLWQELIAQVKADLVTPDAWAACGGRLKANGWAPRRLVTLAGEIEFRHQRFRCTECGAEVVPLDAALGLEPRTAHTLGVRELACRLVTELSYQKTVEAAAELRGLSIGRGELHRWVVEEGRRLEAAIEAETEAVFGEGRDLAPSTARRGTVWVSADGTMVNDRASGTEFEAKLGLVFHGAQRTGRARRALTNRTYVGGTGGWAAIPRALRRRLRPTRRLRGGAHHLRLRRRSSDPLAPGEGIPDGDRTPRLVPPHRAAPDRDRVRPPRSARARPRRRRGGRRRAPRGAPRRLGGRGGTGRPRSGPQARLRRR
ncbi:MAG: hypothetical protein KatS3mg065_0615 [Chloroflexota bacterium]|nr:MAG: hypothetical protein KatS3mg065_0615 [Chloroflexota bacterium]